MYVSLSHEFLGTSNDVAKSQRGKPKPEVHVREPTDGTKKKKKIEVEQGISEEKEGKNQQQ